MARPFKPLQKRPNGVYFVQIHAHGKRHQMSLETRDPIQATARAAQAIQELQARTQTPSQTKWLADMVGTEWDIPTKPDGTNDYDNAVERQVTWGEIATNDDEIKRLGWLDLVREAEQVQKRKTTKGYSDSWHTQMRIAINKCPFSLQEAKPAAIRQWVQEMQQEGLAGRSIELRCSMFRGITQTCIRSGMLEGHSNPWKLVDFSSNSSVPIHTANKNDYLSAFELAESIAKPQQIALLIQIYCGTRISEVTDRQAEDFDLQAGTLTITGAKNKHSNRVVPIPSFICDLLKDFDYKFHTKEIINKKLKQINPLLTSHSFRHGVKRLSRDLKLEPLAIEAMLGHKLPGMESVYGAGFSVEAKREAVQGLWEQLDEWRLNEG